MVIFVFLPICAPHHRYSLRFNSKQRVSGKIRHTSDARYNLVVFILCIVNNIMIELYIAYLILSDATKYSFTEIIYGMRFLINTFNRFNLPY